MGSRSGLLAIWGAFLGPVWRQMRCANGKLMQENTEKKRTPKMKTSHSGRVPWLPGSTPSRQRAVEELNKKRQFSKKMHNCTVVASFGCFRCIPCWVSISSRLPDTPWARPGELFFYKFGTNFKPFLLSISVLQQQISRNAFVLQ